jgi:hypothetical protein
MDKLQQLREALEQQRAYERENWPFVGEDNKPTGTGASITYHLASLYCWSPGYVLTLPPEERDERLQEVWRSFSLAGDIIHRYEDATVALLKEEATPPRSGECVECGRFSSLLSVNGSCEGCVMQAVIDAQEESER